MGNSNGVAAGVAVFDDLADVRVWPPVDWPVRTTGCDVLLASMEALDHDVNDEDGYQNEDLDECRAELTAWGL